MYKRLLLYFVSLLLFSLASGQSCTTTLYANYYDAYLRRADFFLPLPGGGTIFGGQSFFNSDKIAIIKIDERGDLVWSKHLDAGLFLSSPVIGKMTPDYKLLIGGRANLSLLDTNGTFLKGIYTTFDNDQDYLWDVEIDSVGNIYGLFHHHSLDYRRPDSYMLAKYNASLSAVEWTTSFGGSYAYFKNLSLYGNDLFVCGEYRRPDAAEMDGGVFRFSTQNGALKQQLSFTLNEYRTTVQDIQGTDDGFILKGFYHPAMVPDDVYFQRHMIVRLDTALVPVRAFRFQNIDVSDACFIIAEPDGSFYGAASYPFSAGLFYCNKQDSIVWTRSNDYGMYMAGDVGQFVKTASHLNVLTSSPTTVERTDLNGVANCATNQVSIRVIPLSISVLENTLVATDTTLMQISAATLSLNNVNLNRIQRCSYKSTCSSIKLIGKSSICTGTGSVNFTARRNSGCRLPVQWEIKGSKADSYSANDSTVTVRFLQSGKYLLIGKLAGGCKDMPYADTLSVEVSVNVAKSDLGHDQSLCPGNTILLNAHSGYATYLWQDGSTDSTFSVTRPGLYHVTTTDACGGVYSDTIRITAAPPIAFSVGPDRTKCNGDTLRLSVPDGFLSYTWSNHYNISSTTSQTVVVNPLVDTAYYVKAEKTPGCFAYDTVRVKVHHSPPIDLRADRSLCLGDSAVFNAGTGFASYLWSNGHTGPSLTTKTAGTYSVVATTAEGCQSRDTVRVLQVYALPQPRLDKNPGLCAEESRTLNPGLFALYQWSNGSTAPAITVSGAGTYAVTVTDGNGCKAGDTTVISVIYPLPAGFLPPDTAICSYGSLVLMPSADFRNYNWSNGASAKAVTITLPGQYWLEVTDNRGCRGRNTVVVNPKDCLSGFYVPSAFSPNGDGRNDLFRPLLFGHVKSYRFTVYNRWGQVIFQSTELQKGWNGKLAGMALETGVFVWTCSYQLEGEAVKSEKGTVTLIR